MNDKAEHPVAHSNADALGDGRLQAASAARNIAPIVAAMAAQVRAGGGRALEIASGTGEHALAYAEAFGALTWQPTDIAPDRLASIEAWRQARAGDNLLAPRMLDAAQPGWDIGRFDLVTVTNLFHLISDAAGRRVIEGAARALDSGGQFFVYGPFREAGAFRSQGDARFHAALVAADESAGYKDTQWLVAQGAAQGLAVAARVEMPANNLFFVFAKG